MRLDQLIRDVAIAQGGSGPSALGSAENPEIKTVCCRAQEVTPGSLFVAVKGFTADGHDYIPQAVERGAAAVVCETCPQIDENVVTVPVDNSRQALADVAAAFYGHPSRRMVVIGITGTNGKTTASYMIESILARAGHIPGVIGTINYRFEGQVQDNPVTTPESLDLQRIMSEMLDAGVTHVVMEVSSHALDLHRVHRCKFDIGVFTNFSQDHLDYHKDMAHYWNCKRKLFTELLPQYDSTIRQRAVINTADPKGGDLARQMQAPYLSCGSAADSDVQVSNPRFSLAGTQARIHTPLGGVTIQSPLVGRHNLENILNAVGVGVALEIPLPTIASGIQRLDNVPGRLESVPNTGGRYVYVDYAHTPDALENVLLALRGLTADRIVCIFGCGGDRDKVKRPQMGMIASRLSDLTVVTSDNPRTESPKGIIEDIVEGIRTKADVEWVAPGDTAGFQGKGYTVMPDRRQAIEAVIRESRPGDTILIAGKGHEPYQVVGHEKLPFDDRQEAEAALERLT